MLSIELVGLWVCGCYHTQTMCAMVLKTCRETQPDADRRVHSNLERVRETKVGMVSNQVKASDWALMRGLARPSTEVV
jgi:hypothetical protein